MCRKKKKISGYGKNNDVYGDQYVGYGQPDMGYGQPDMGYGQPYGPDMGYPMGMIQLPPIVQPVIMMPFGMPMPAVDDDDDDDFDDFEDDF